MARNTLRSRPSMVSKGKKETAVQVIRAAMQQRDSEFARARADQELV